MEKHEDKWAEEVLNSMKGYKRARPSQELRAKIEARLAHSKGKVVSIVQWRPVAVAASLVLLVNTTVLLQYQRQNQPTGSESAMENNYDHRLVSTYQIYE